MPSDESCCNVGRGLVFGGGVLIGVIIVGPDVVVVPDSLPGESSLGSIDGTGTSGPVAFAVLREDSAEEVAGRLPRTNCVDC